MIWYSICRLESKINMDTSISENCQIFTWTKDHSSLVQIHLNIILTIYFSKVTFDAPTYWLTAQWIWNSLVWLLFSPLNIIVNHSFFQTDFGICFWPDWKELFKHHHIMLVERISMWHQKNKLWHILLIWGNNHLIQ